MASGTNGPKRRSSVNYKGFSVLHIFNESSIPKVAADEPPVKYP